MARRRLRGRIVLLRRKVIRLRKAITTSRFWTLIRYYIGQKKWTVATLTVSSLASLFIVWWIYSLYLPVESRTRMSIQGTSEYDITRVEIYIEYNPRGEDKVTTYVSLAPTSSDVVDKVFFITNSPNLTYQREGSFFAGLEYFDCRPYFSMCFRFKDSGRRTLILNFSGNAFGHGGQDEKLDFSVTVTKNAVNKNVPMKIAVNNLSDVNIGTVVPEPTARYVGGFAYDFDPSSDALRSEEIIITGVNRESIYSTQFKLFLLGTFLGILVSLITTIFLEFIQKYESNEPIE